MYDTILLPTDGSDGTDRIVDQALSLAREYEATLHVLHVVDTGTVPLDRHSKALFEDLEAAGEASVDAIREQALDVGVHAVTELRRGEPYEEILASADENDVDMIVIGTHGRTGLPRSLLGSVAERVVRFSDVPVLTVRTIPSDRESQRRRR